MNYTVKEIFPTPIYQSTIDPVILSSHQEELLQICEKSILTKDFYINDHKIDKDKRHVLEKFPVLKEHLQKHLDTFTKNIIGETDKFKLYITTSWCVGLDPGRPQMLHQHENSIVSGCMYFGNEDVVSDIAFFRDVSVAYNPHFNLNPTQGSKFTYRESRITPKNGMLILFPAHVKHKVYEHNGKRKRNCLCFDSFVRGELGERRTLLTI